MMTLKLVFLAIVISAHCHAEVYFVSTYGNDATGDGSRLAPWRTIKYSLQKVQGGKAHTINIAPGIYIERPPLAIPPLVNLRGAGKDSTVIKGTASFYYHPRNPGFEPDRFLVQLDGPLHTSGGQNLSGFTVDGSAKRIHGGIYINGRNNVRIENVKVQETNFCGIWILNATDIQVRKVSLRNCAWGSNEWCSGAFQFAYVDNVVLDQLDIDEGRGYGIKTLGQDKAHIFKNFKLHNSRISVNPKGLWKQGKAPNIAVEIWANSFAESEIYNCYFDNHISIVNSDHNALPTGQMFRIHHNTFDIQSRAKGKGYGIELTIHDAEIDHNFFNGGYSGISNWAHAKKNWSIHHNVFYGITGIYPTAIINAHKGNLNNVHIYNNTVELAGNTTVNFLQCDNGGVSEDVVIRNNLIINSNTAYSHYPNRFINLKNGATIKNLVVENNLLTNLHLGELEGIIRDNLFVDPRIRGIGSRPIPYYLPESDSPLISGEKNKGSSSMRRAQGIGAYESPEF